MNPCAPGLKMDLSPAGVTIAIAVSVSVSTSTGTNNAPIAASLISRASNLMPKYSGVLPMSRPATKTVITIMNSIE